PFTSFVVGLLAITLAAGLTATTAVAASDLIEQAKSQCIVGEQADGYLGVVSGASASSELRREVRDINQRRKAYYADIARRNGVSVEVTAVLTAEKLINQARSGHCVRDQRGNWIEK
ncbi:MAG: YdbL family protein, partial [Alphaproteobacteria bacterium]|nr:YdbL family protein [Alphaproteobacteria bacterium]